MRIQFTKMHGLGNDFVVIDAISQHVSLRTTHIQRLSNRHTGIGFDQLLLIEPPSRPDADFNYRIFNADGHEVKHCGNGAWRAVHPLRHRIGPSVTHIAAPHGLVCQNLCRSHHSFWPLFDRTRPSERTGSYDQRILEITSCSGKYQG